MEHADFWAEHRAHEEKMMGLAKLRLGGLTYKKLSALTEEMSPSVLSKNLKPYEKRYKELCEKNLAKLEESLKRIDPDYDYLADPRTALQQNCALLMGGKETMAVLEQLQGLR